MSEAKRVERFIKWRLAPDSDPRERHIITTADGETEICGIVHSESHADLFAAAPDLLEAIYRAEGGSCEEPAASEPIDQQNFRREVIRALAAIHQKLDQITGDIKRMSTKYDDDIAALSAGIEANTAAITQFVAIHKADTDTIASLNQQIADLKAANPAIDLSGLEADIAKLSANNVLATSITAAPAETPVPDPAQPAGPAPTV